MRKKCNNCTYLYKTKNEAWCTRQLQYTNVDGCCKEFKRKSVIANSSLVALIIAAIAFALSLSRLIMALL
jgi:hypothetical protein